MNLVAELGSCVVSERPTALGDWLLFDSDLYRLHSRDAGECCFILLSLKTIFKGNVVIVWRIQHIRWYYHNLTHFLVSNLPV